MSFYAPGSPLIGIVANNPEVETKIVLQNSILWGAPVWCDEKAPKRLSIEVDRCELVTNLTFHFKQAMPDEGLSVKIRNSILQSFGNILQVPRPLTHLHKTISWQGSGNIYFVQGNLALAQDGGVKSLDDWHGFRPDLITESG